MVRTHSAGNVGSVVRLCGNYGVKLRLVDVQCDPIGKEARTFAAGDLRPLDEMGLFSSLEEAVDDLDVVVGTSSKLLPAKEAPVLDADNARRFLPHDGESVALVFGNERDGLTVDESAVCDRVVRLHTPGWHDSLNLSHAVGAVLALLTSASSSSSAPKPSLSPKTRERLIDDWLGLLRDADYFKSTSPDEFRGRLARLVDKFDVDDKDAALLQGMLRQLSARRSG